MTDAELRPYGYRPGSFRTAYCQSCHRKFKGDVKAFKCRPCAEHQFNEVERILDGAEED